MQMKKDAKRRAGEIVPKGNKCLSVRESEWESYPLPKEAE